MHSNSLPNRLGILGAARAPRDFTARVMRAVGLADRFAAFESPIGRVYVAWNDRGISAVMRVADVTAFERAFAARFGRSVEPAAKIPVTLRRAIATGDSAAARKLRYDLRSLTPFEAAVLRKALEIPRGQVRPYGWIAREIGKPKAVRAVGTALAKNPIPLLLPCHRVVRTDGMIGNYALGGSAKKKILLTSEGVNLKMLEEKARAGIRFNGAKSTKIFCWPTCGGPNQRLMPKNTRPFHDEREARAAGYRPCKVCRPAA
jgi:O-6-methylguanine DNA methyltransferase